MTGLHLMVLATVLATLAPRVLRPAGWAYRAPGLAIAAWYVLLLTVLVTVLGAGFCWLAPWSVQHSPACTVWRWSLDAAGGAFGSAGRIALAALLAGAGVLAVQAVLTMARLGRAATARRARHRELLSLAGRRDRALGATIVEHPQPAAYTLAGRDRRIVVTTGAVAALTPAELAAVVAHERAHASGRHDLLVDVVRLLAAAAPRVPLFAIGRVQLARLVEIRADQAATAGQPPINLARALVTMATAQAGPVPVAAPAGSLAAVGGDAAERLRRLLAPPMPLSVTHRSVIGLGLALLAATPGGVLAAVHLLPVLNMCPVCWV